MNIITDSLDQDMQRLSFNLINVGINMKVVMQKFGIPVIEYYKAQLKALKK